jgi:hypothetical protein
VQIAFSTPHFRVTLPKRTYPSVSLLMGMLAFALLLGCGSNVSFPLSDAVHLGGTVRGGPETISGSSIQLYAAGTTGNGSAATPLITKDIRTDSSGNFDITGLYTCPSSDSIVYIVAQGGNPGLAAGTNNSSIALLAALGPCGGLTSATPIAINEVTTIASLWPLAPYAKSLARIGFASVATYTGVGVYINSLANIPVGVAPGPMLTPPDIAPTAKLNTLAGIFSACVDSSGGEAGDGTACGRLFSDATVGSTTPPSDTVAASLAIAQNPTQNVDEIYDLSPSSPPFQPTIASPPSDWTLPIISPPVTPVLSPAGGSYASGQQVNIAETTAGASIYYTTDGSAPTSSSAMYSGSFTLTHSQTVNAVAIVDTLNSAVASDAYTINAPGSLSLTPASVTLAPLQAQTFSAKLANSTNTAVTWRLSPVVGSMSNTGVYTAPEGISVAQMVTVTATSVADPSETATGSIKLTPLPAPSISPLPGAYATAQSVSLSDGIPGVSIYYTTDGSAPSMSSPLYSGAITIAATKTVKAIAVLNGVSSPLVGGTYTIAVPAVGSPASTLAFLTQPSDAIAGAAIAPGITVIAEDASGNPVAMPSVPVILSLAANPSGGTLTGMSTETASASGAAFPNVSITRAGAGYQLIASAKGLASAVSSSFTIEASGPSSPTAPAGEQPASAMDFTNTVGINVHLDFANTLYTSNFPLILASLKDLRLSHVRDGLADWGTGPAAYYTAHKTLAANGIHADFITSLNQPASLIQAYPARVGDMEAVEAPNEYDTSGNTNWAAALRSYLPVIQSAVDGDHPMPGITVIGPSLVNQKWYSANNSYALLGPVSGFFAQGNLHNYPGGRNPGTPGWTPQGYGSIAFAIRTAQTEWPSSPLVSTEDGYWDNPSAEGDPDPVIAKYIPRMLLEQYLDGIKRTYLYELADDQLSGGLYGLLRSDGTQKPQYVALKSMMQMISDPGAAYSTTRLVYAFSNSASDVHHLLLQKRDGTYLLAIWVEEPCYDVNAKASHTVASRSMHINFAKPVSVQGVYQWQADGTTVNTVSGLQSSSLPVAVSDELTIVQFTAP